MDLNKLEEYLKKKILPDLVDSRGGFDKIHTLEVVDWIKQIINHSPKLKLDQVVLITAAYAHDWGYSGIFKKGQVMNNEIIDNAKPLHMVLGAEKTRKLLDDDFFSFLTGEQKERCIHLVAVHDKKYEIKDTDEIVLMEADMLSTLDVDTDKPIIDSESNKAVMDSILNIRLPKFVTQFSRDEAEKLIKRRINYFEEQGKKP